MGACLSSAQADVSEEEKMLHREAEKCLKEVRFFFFNLFGGSISLPTACFAGQGENGDAGQGP
jgi:hypothetical protein